MHRENDGEMRSVSGGIIHFASWPRIGISGIGTGSACLDLPTFTKPPPLRSTVSTKDHLVADAFQPRGVIFATMFSGEKNLCKVTAGWDVRHRLQLL